MHRRSDPELMNKWQWARMKLLPGHLELKVRPVEVRGSRSDQGALKCSLLLFGYSDMTQFRCMKKEICRKWTLDSSQGHNGRCSLPLAGKTKWLWTALSSAARSLNTDVFLPSGCTQRKENIYVYRVYIYSLCVGVWQRGWIYVCLWMRVYRFVGRMNLANIVPLLHSASLPLWQMSLVRVPLGAQEPFKSLYSG